MNIFDTSLLNHAFIHVAQIPGSDPGMIFALIQQGRILYLLTHDGYFKSLLFDLKKKIEHAYFSCSCVISIV